MAGLSTSPDEDLDLPGFCSPSPSAIAAKIREIAAVAGDEGIVFDLDSIEFQIIAEDAAHEGVRAKLVARLDQARIHRLRNKAAFETNTNSSRACPAKVGSPGYS